MQCLEVETLKTTDRVVVATKELERVIELVKSMPDVPKQTIDLENGVRDDYECDIEEPITSKTKGPPKGSRLKWGVEVAKKSNSNGKRSVTAILGICATHIMKQKNSEERRDTLMRECRLESVNCYDI
ncbi:hypothetical protein Lal_00040416 [Lupinus albus]|nr:hypothetical protein Lal_00040416 [Lupinus albus]